MSWIELDGIRDGMYIIYIYINTDPRLPKSNTGLSTTEDKLYIIPFS